MVRWSDLPFPLPVPLVQSWLYIPNEAVGDPTSMGAKLANNIGRPTRTVGYLLLAIMVRNYTLCPPGTFATLAPTNMHTQQFTACACIVGRSLALMVVFYGGWHTWLYGNGGGPVLAKLAPRKFNKDPSNKGYHVYRDILASTWGTVISAVYELSLLYLCDTSQLHLDGYHTNQPQSQADFLGTNAVRNIGIMLLIPYWVEAHFYFGHRTLHMDQPYCRLYKYIHSFHHKAVNPGPWSGLSMHPFEHVVFFSACLLPYLLPCNMHVLHVLFILTYTRISPIGGHDGYDKPLGGSLVHYLHHTKFNVNYGTPVVPFDEWFGTYDDGASFRAKTGLEDITQASPDMPADEPHKTK